MIALLAVITLGVYANLAVSLLRRVPVVRTLAPPPVDAVPTPPAAALASPTVRVVPVVPVDRPTGGAQFHITHTSLEGAPLPDVFAHHDPKTATAAWDTLKQSGPAGIFTFWDAGHDGHRGQFTRFRDPR